MNNKMKYYLGITSGIATVIVILIFAIWSKIKLNVEILDEIIVENNDTRIDIRRMLNSFYGMEMSYINLADIEDTLKTISTIRNVVATKRYPNRLLIKIEKRNPVAYMYVKNELRMIDEAGYILEAVDTKKILPLISGEIKINEKKGIHRMDTSVLYVANLCKEITQSSYAKYLLTDINVNAGTMGYYSGAMKMYASNTNGKTKFIFGRASSYKEKIEDFETFWNKVMIYKGDIYSSVDFRFKNKIYVKS